MLLLSPSECDLAKLAAGAQDCNIVHPTSALRACTLVISSLLALSEFSRPARAGTLYWDTDGSTAGNNASTGMNLGGSGSWSSADANWWDPGFGVPQAWSDGSDAVFW